MIDIVNEELFTLREAREFPMFRRRGKSPLYASVHRWATQGHKGVKLETVVRPDGMCTSTLACVRFLERLSMPIPSMRDDTPSQRKTQIERAGAILDAALAPKRKSRHPQPA
jgi:hypothetical protein